MPIAVGHDVPPTAPTVRSAGHRRANAETSAPASRAPAEVIATAGLSSAAVV
ncbi:MAG: hypothetical protein PGN37_27090 [Mycobacterium kyogaense]|uniref:hypothetical protein n=1 Tax=Mycobacterium kyogaense TaxID=2212479 RepID=UPI002FFC0C2F